MGPTAYGYGVPEPYLAPTVVAPGAGYVVAAPYGLNGIAEAPTIASTAAIVAAIRAASGRELTRVPVRPDDIVGLGAPA